MRVFGSDSISSQWASQPTMRATAKNTVKMRGRKPIEE